MPYTTLPPGTHVPEDLALVPAPRAPLDAPRPPQDVLLLDHRDLTHPEGGGSELYVETLGRRLAARGDRVTLFCAAHRNAPRDEVKDGIRYVRRGGNLTVFLWGAWLMARGRLGREGVVLEVQNGMPFLARLWTRRRVVVLVHHVHREQWPIVFGPLRARFGWWLESWLAPRVARHCDYVAVSEATKAELVGLGVDADRITVVRNGTPAGARAACGRSTVPTVAVLGRVVPHKRIELVLQAAAALRADVPDLRVEIAGDGYWLPHVRAAVAELGLDDVVAVLGRVTEQEKADLLARAWVHAVPSVKEGWGLSVVEAGSYGTPSVAFRGAGGLAESIVDGRTGLLVDDAEGLREALRTLLGDEALRRRLGEGARQHAAGFTWDGATSAFSDLLTARPVS